MTMAMIDEGATAIVEMLFCTSLVALVSAGDKPSASPRRLQIVNTKASLDVQASSLLFYSGNNPANRPIGPYACPLSIP